MQDSFHQHYSSILARKHEWWPKIMRHLWISKDVWLQKREVLPSKAPNKNTMPPFIHHPKPSQKNLKYFWQFALQETSLKLVVVVFPIAFLTAQPALLKVRESPAKVVGLHKFSTLAKLVGFFPKNSINDILKTYPPQNDPKIAPGKTPQPQKDHLF